MRIYIDEAGLFVVPPAGSYSYSLVLALVIPSAHENQVLHEFMQLRDDWPAKGIEIKGSTLDEKQTSQIIQILLRHDVLVGFLAVNMATHDDLLVGDMKRRQADALLAHLTPEHKPSMVQSLEQLADGVRKMPNQLFLQAFTTMHMILELLQDATLYYVQRIPEELGDISWTIDRKDRTITQMEYMWTTLILPISENHYVTKPFGTLEGADYSHFDKRYGFTKENIGPDMARHTEWLRSIYGTEPLDRTGRGVDAGLVLREQREFKDSRDCPGLQLADILATTLRRALNGNLRIEGWRDFGGLIVRKRNIGSYFMQLGPGFSPVTPKHAEGVCYVLDRRAKGMLVQEREAS